MESLLELLWRPLTSKRQIPHPFQPFWMVQEAETDIWLI